MRFELMTARLRIGCSTTELLWQVLRVPWSGLEPLCLTAPPPQDGVSTNFTTRAYNTDPSGADRALGDVDGADGTRTRDLSSDSRVL